MSSPGEDYCILASAIDEETGRRFFENDLSILHDLDDPYILRETYALSDYSSTRGDSAVLDLRVSALFSAIAERLTHASRREGMKSHAWYAAEARRLSENVFDFRTVAQIAEELSISPDYLRHVFKRHFGFTLKSCIDSMRIKRAKELLALSNMPQKIIAEQCGFSNESYFNTAFKRSVNTTPGKFRESTRF
jgi:two-component system response regulator YesN